MPWYKTDFGRGPMKFIDHPEGKIPEFMKPDPDWLKSDGADEIAKGTERANRRDDPLLE